LCMFEFPVHSPVEHIDLPFCKDIHLDIKRDDMIHPFISGNKWRKLKYLLRTAHSMQKRKLVTFGGSYSNHLLATACAAARFGFQSIGFVRGEENSPLNDVLFLCRQFGMELIYSDRESYKNKKALFYRHFGEDADAFFIDEGGASEEAVQGCAELITELVTRYDHIVLACGTASTMSGIIRGIDQHQLPTRVEGICIHKGSEELQHAIQGYCPGNTQWTLHTEHHLGGYAKTNPAYLQWLSNFNQSTGILLDPVYTGKMMLAISDLATSRYFAPNSRILAIHTGGLFGILGMKEKF
jgi:1-aminocyclopropane-1-carboxylate deaminase